MGNQRFPFQENHIYHVYNRGLNKQTIFHKPDEFEFFSRLIIKYQLIHPEVKILSFSFLPNHFHFVMKQTQTGLHISQFMKKVQGTYATWYRYRHPSEIKLPVFQGRFNSKLIQDDAYLYQCLSYVNYNPVKHGLVKNIEDYPYTSYHQIMHGKKGISLAGNFKGHIESWKDIVLAEMEF